MKQTEQKLHDYFEEPKKENVTLALQKTILLAEEELQGKEKKKTKGFVTFLLEQIQMTGMWIWMFQAGVILVISLLLFLVTGMDFSYFTVRRFAFWTGMLGILLFTSTIPFLYRAKRYQMLEIEATAKYSVGEILITRILMIGIGDFLMLFGIVWQIGKISSFPVLQTVFCLCLPFLLAFNGGIYLLRKVTFVHFQKWAYGMCFILCGMLLGVIWCYPRYYEMKIVLAGFAMVFLIGVMVYQCMILFHENVQSVYE